MVRAILDGIGGGGDSRFQQVLVDIQSGASFGKRECREEATEDKIYLWEGRSDYMKKALINVRIRVAALQERDLLREAITSHAVSRHCHWHVVEFLRWTAFLTWVVDSIPSHCGTRRLQF